MPRKLARRLRNFLVFNGTSTYLTLPIVPLITGFSLGFWATKQNNTNNARILDWQDSGPTNGFSILELTNFKIECAFRNGAAVNAALDGNKAGNGDLKHYVLTFDGTVAKLYENGSLIVTDSSATIAAASAIFTIGKRSGGSNFWKGKMAELVFQNTTTPWTQQQINDLYYKGVIPNGSSYYLFEDNVLDGSKNIKHGTLANGSYQTLSHARSLASGRTTPKQNYIKKEGTLFEDFETVGDFTLGGTAGGALTAETLLYKTGSKSIKLVTAGGASSNAFATKTISANFSKSGTFGIWLYVFDKTKVSGITFYLSSTSGFTKYFSRPKTVFHNGWNFIQFNKAEWGNTGGEDWNNTMIRMRVRVDAVANQVASVLFDSVYYGIYARPKIMINFDDNWDDCYTEGYTYMATKGMKGTVFVISDDIGAANKATKAQLQTMYDADWDMGNHTKTHANLSLLSTAAEIEAELRACENVLFGYGWTRAHKYVAYPNGGYNDLVLSVMASLQETAGYTILGAGISTVKGIPNPYLLRRYSLTMSDTLTTVKGYVDDAIRSGQSMVLNFHLLVAVPSVSTEWAISDFQALIDYIKTKVDADLCDVVTVSEWFEGLSQNRQLAVSRSLVS